MRLLVQQKETEITDQIVGARQIFYYDVLAHRIIVTPAKNTDRALEANPRKSPLGNLSFDGVDNISISSLDNIVIGECLEFNLASHGESQRCEMKFDDFGTEVLVAFTFKSSDTRQR